MKTVGSLERLSNPPLDHSGFVDGFLSTKKRGIRQLTTSETASKELKTGDGDGDSSEAYNGYKNDDNSDNNDADTTSSRDEKRGTPVEILLAEEEEAAERRVKTACVSHGLASVIGRRRAMEDAVAVAIGEIDSYDFFAVYDGHGGARVANACRERMHRLVAEEVIAEAGGLGGGVAEVAVDWQKVMAVSFEKMDAEVSSGEGGGGGCGDEGSTAVVVMVGKEVVVVANCGDSRAVMCRGGVAVPLSRDHKVMLRRFLEKLLRTYSYHIA